MRRLSTAAMLAVLDAGLLVACPGARAQAAMTNTAPVGNVQIQRNILGSGSPGEEPGGYENAERVIGDVYHVPQFLPGYPTSATLWPRVIDVPCTRAASGEIQCQGYHWLPKYGRAEYLFFRPVLVAGPTAEAPSPEEAPVASGPPLPARADRH